MVVITLTYPSSFDFFCYVQYYVRILKINHPPQILNSVR